jgi:hypothetical protein
VAAELLVVPFSAAARTPVPREHASGLKLDARWAGCSRGRALVMQFLWGTELRLLCAASPCCCFPSWPSRTQQRPDQHGNTFPAAPRAGTWVPSLQPRLPACSSWQRWWPGWCADQASAAQRRSKRRLSSTPTSRAPPPSPVPRSVTNTRRPGLLSRAGWMLCELQALSPRS